jgi:hypothetical protein
MDIHVFLLCYNESALIPHTVHHYRKYLPTCKITVYDNQSTDNSVEIATSLGCTVVSWSSNNILNEYLQISLRNTIWKNVATGWIIMADMDEFVCVTEPQLLEETKQGTTILKIVGINVVGQSTTDDLTDIDLQKLTKYVDNPMESKSLCFLREHITEMNYGPGSHTCTPVGKIKFSKNTYVNKHMEMLGLTFITNKMVRRYARTSLMRKHKMSTHYTNDLVAIKNKYMNTLKKCKQMR